MCGQVALGRIELLRQQAVCGWPLAEVDWSFVLWFVCIPLALWSFQNLSVFTSCLSCSRGHDEIESGSTDRGPTRQATIRSRLRRKLQTDADAEDDDEKRTLRAEVLPQDGRISDLATKRLSLNIKKLYDLESLHRREL